MAFYVDPGVNLQYVILADGHGSPPCRGELVACMLSSSPDRGLDLIVTRPIAIPLDRPGFIENGYG